MSLGAVLSSSAITNQIIESPRYAITSADYPGFKLSHLKGKNTTVYRGLHVRHRFHLTKILSFHKRNLKPDYLAFVLPNGNDGDEKGSLHTFNENMLLPLGDDENSESLDVQVASSVCHSETDLSQNVKVQRLDDLLDKVKAVQSHILASEMWNASHLKLCDRNYSASAANLIHYLALRCLDVEELKEDLSFVGLLNLKSTNSNVLASIMACIQLLENLSCNSSKHKKDSRRTVINRKILDHPKEKFTIQAMRKKAHSNRELLLGPLQDSRTNYIMVTVGEEAISNEMLITDLVKAGASIIRINCAHGSCNVWNEIIRRVKENSQMLEKPCRILMDLAGPKLRTGNLKPGPSVLKISPKKDAAGNVIFPAQVWLSHREADPPPAHVSIDQVLFIDNQKLLSELEVGDTLRLRDARGKKRMLNVSRKIHVFAGTGYVLECARTAYVQSGTKLYMKRKRCGSLVGRVVDLPAKEQYVRLRVGDLLIISRASSSEQHELSVSMNGAHRITCSSGYLFDSVKPGESIAFDDGKIWGVIQGTGISEIVVSITRAGPKGTKLGSGKSINIPESNVQFEGLTSKDIMDLKFVAAHADMVGVSFVRDVRDIILVCRELEKRKLRDLGIILKIETKCGFENLPSLLLEAMKSPNPLGVMIARGDLAVECGWERLADLQEEILSVCDAAHIPVIWATQVLESLAKSGVPTRAEITDAANGKRASCVMLNKGKHIVEAVSTLDEILHANSTRSKPFYSLASSLDKKLSSPSSY